jgi:hypothetical protein
MELFVPMLQLKLTHYPIMRAFGGKEFKVRRS